MRTFLIPAMLGIATLPGAVAAQTSHAAAAEATVRRLDAERRIARQQLRIAREQDRLDAERAKLERISAPATPPAATAPPVAPATPSAPAAPPAPSMARSPESARAIPKPQDDNFGKFGFGGGLSLTIDLGQKDRIAEAQIVNKIVRVTDQNNAVARLLLEGHFLFKPKGEGPFGLAENMWGVGPFVAVQPGKERIIDAIGLGLMIAFRREEGKTDSFNIGLGLMIDPDTRVLGDGFVANAAPPEGEDEVRYRETAQKGLMLMTSFSF